MLYIDIDHINRIHTSLYFIFIVSIIDCVSSIILEILATSDTYVSNEHTVWIHIAIILAIKAYTLSCGQDAHIFSFYTIRSACSWKDMVKIDV